MTAITASRWTSVAEAAAHYSRELDAFAGTVRLRFAFSSSIDEEYQLTANQAQAFVDSGYTLDPVPDTVLSWADATGQTPTWAADNIIATRDLYLSAIEGVRRIRLVAKAQMAQATTAREVRAIHDYATAQLDAIQPPA
jgi:hypothetical protein